MNAEFSIEYHPSCGETLFLCIGGKRHAMSLTGAGVWTVAVNRVRKDALTDYCYEVEYPDGTVRKEWGRHSLNLPSLSNLASASSASHSSLTMVSVSDRWMDEPEDAPFYSSAFSEVFFDRTRCNSDGGLDRKACAREDRGLDASYVLIAVDMPSVAQDEVLAVAGDGPGMANWQKALPMDGSGFPHWQIALDSADGFEYKFVIADRVTLEIKEWEHGENRRCSGGNSGVFSVYADNVHRFGIRHWRAAGTAIPVFSLRSCRGFGIGEFPDIKLMVDWAVATGQRIIQLLPVNDTTVNGTWTDSYPYNAVSAFALHPQYVNLVTAGVKETAEYRRVRDELNSLPKVDYERVNREKMSRMHRLFEQSFKKLSVTTPYKEFYENNKAWLEPYAAFCTLRDKFGTADFGSWGEFAEYSDNIPAKLRKEMGDSMDYCCFVQYHLDRQFREARDYAHANGVVLKGDLPIGVSKTGVEAWQYPQLFNIDESAGAPPDAFARDGQNWGFPTYNWDEMAKDGYAWWKSRLKKMSEYFDAFRIDHILGFFRIWEIPTAFMSGLAGHFSPALPYPSDELVFEGFDLDRVGGCADLDGCDDCSSDETGQGDNGEEGFVGGVGNVLFVADPYRKNCWHPAIAAKETECYRQLDEGLRHKFDRLYEDFFYHRHNEFWRESAMRKLPELLRPTGMLACGEDLGMIPACVPSVMADLKILSLEIQRMPKNVGEEFANTAAYPYLCVCTTSTHDMSPLRAWWEEDRDLSARFFHRLYGAGAEPPYFCEPWLCRRIVQEHLDSPAMLTILPLQDWLSLDGDIRYENPAEERINVPAQSRHYWRYRMHITLEDLISRTAFNDGLNSMVKSSGR